MYSTLKNISNKTPHIDPNSHIGRYLRSPNTNHLWTEEAGMRLRGWYKERSKLTPLVSVVTTVYNRQSVLEKAICSVLTQSYDNIEYIVVDGGSSDGTMEVVRKYDDVIDYIVSEPDGGLYEGMNKGLELAQGDFVIILNSDDWYEPDCLERLVDAALQDNLELVCALATETDAAGKVLRKIPMGPFRDNVRLRMPLRHETMLVSKHLYNRVGLYDPTYKIIGDLKLTQKMYDEVKGFKQLNENVMFFRKDGIACELNESFFNERERLILENFPFLSNNEAKILANEYKDNISTYIEIVQKHPKQRKLVSGIKGYLSLHGLLAPGRLTVDLSIFDDY
jgi:glycosyltransferase involved in cell wall biosynthesis